MLELILTVSLCLVCHVQDAARDANFLRSFTSRALSMVQILLYRVLVLLFEHRVFLTAFSVHRLHHTCWIDYSEYSGTHTTLMSNALLPR